MTETQQSEMTQGEKAGGGLSAVRDTAAHAVETVKESAASAVGGVKDSASAVARRTADTIEGNPLAVLVGGLAVGVLAGALLPRTQRETEVLGPVGRRLHQGAAMAARAAREAGTAELAAHGISRDAAQSQVKKLFEQVVSAAKSAGSAAAQASREGARQGFKDQG